jgi:stage V sporulation protein K
MQLDQKRRLCGLAAHGKAGQSMHMIFSGNPGTGKTTIGRLVAELLTALGKLPKGHLVETDRAGLVAPYCGQTALKVQEIVRSAIGGMLFVDEAYALVKDPKDTFGKEALDTLIKLVEDHRDDLVVVLAGYPAEMEELLSHNPGVRSRFPTVIQFDDYEVGELEQIAGGMLSKASMRLDDGAKAAMRKTFEAIVKAGGKESGNGRAVRNVVEKALRAQAMRLAGLESTMSPAELSLLIERDFA